MQKTPDIELICGLCERGLEELDELISLKMGHICHDCVRNLAAVVLPEGRYNTRYSASIRSKRSANLVKTAAIIDLDRFRLQAQPRVLIDLVTMKSGETAQVSALF